MFRTFELSDPRFEQDGLRLITVKSAALHGRADITLWVPPGHPPVGTVLLLHGVYGSHWGWSLRGGAHRTAARLLASGEIPPLVLAMPSDGLRGDGSAYLRHPDADFERWIVDEVPTATRRAVPSLPDASPLCIAGLSMGGFGALRLAARHGDRFLGASGHSSVTDLQQLAPFLEEPIEGFACPPAEASVLETLRSHRTTLPHLRFDCGTEDPLLEANRELHHALDSLGIPHEYAEFPGDHSWPYWETHLADTLHFFAKHMPPA